MFFGCLGLSQASGPAVDDAWVAAVRAALDAGVTLLDTAMKPVRVWNLINAYPVKWTGGDLNASSTEILTETLVWRPVSEIEPLTIDLQALFEEALGELENGDED